MSRKATLNNRMQDPNRQDYGLRVGVGTAGAINIRGGTRITKLFPDGVKLEVTTANGGVRIGLYNRVTGANWRIMDKGTIKYAEFATTKITGESLRPFAAISPVSVQPVTGGLVIQLPSAENLAPPRPRSKRSDSKRKSRAATNSTQLTAHRAELVEKLTAVPAQPVAASQPEPTVDRGTPPEMDLFKAVRAINHWKRYLGEGNMVIGLLPDGTIDVLPRFS